MWPFALVAIVFLLVAFSGRAAAQSQPVAVTPCPLSAQYVVGTTTADTVGNDMLAATAGYKWDVYQVSIYNSSTTPTFIKVYMNGTGGTLLGYVPAPAQEPGGMPIPAGFALRATAGQDRD